MVSFGFTAGTVTSNSGVNIRTLGGSSYGHIGLVLLVGGSVHSSLRVAVGLTRTGAS